MAERAGVRVEEKTMRAINAAMENTRLQILFLLGERGSMYVGDIAAHFSISRPAISHHLKILKSSDLVKSVRKGQEIFYQVNRSHLAFILRTIADAMQRCCS